MEPKRGLTRNVMPKPNGMSAKRGMVAARDRLVEIPDEVKARFDEEDDARKWHERQAHSAARVAADVT